MDEIAAMRARGETHTSPDAPVVDLDEDFWRTAKVVMPSDKTSVHIRLDSDVFEWFRAQGKGHISRMSAVLRSYMEAHRRSDNE